MKDLTYFKEGSVIFLEPHNEDSLDLILCYCGIEQCEPSYSYGPSIRSQYLIHFILEGEGTYHIDNKVYHLSKNQGFLIPPSTVTYYEASKENPWHYMWIGFNGVRAETFLNYAHLSHKQPIFSFENITEIESIVLQMLELNKSLPEQELQRQSLLYLFLSKIISANKPTNSAHLQHTSEYYLKASINFIHQNYHAPIKVSEIADYIGINRTYLTSIYKQRLNISPKEFITCYRIEKASQLLETTDLSIGDISRSIGYLDPLAFSKVFKKIKKVSPKMYREIKLKKNILNS